MSKITNDGLTRSGTRVLRCFIAVHGSVKGLTSISAVINTVSGKVQIVNRKLVKIKRQRSLSDDEMLDCH